MMRAMSLRVLALRLIAVEPNRRRGWALLLALLLPLAQAMAAGHAFAHDIRSATSRDGGALNAPCAQCLAGAPLASTAPPRALPVLPIVPPVQAPDVATPRAKPTGPRALAYRSRAPPR